MPNFQTYDILKWTHLVAMAIGGGGAVVALLLSGFEDEREDLRGLAATVWKRVCGWSFRIALVLGIVLLVLQFKAGLHPFDARYLHLKLTFAILLVGISEMAPKGLATGKRGAAALALLLFLLTSFVAGNRYAFGRKERPVQVTSQVQP